MDRKLKVIGLTGGIGTGKSTAAEFLKKKGFAHIDADEISRKLTSCGSPLLQILNHVFGPEGEMGDSKTRILKDDGSLDRKGLAAIVFSDRKKTEKLNELMFEAIIQEIDKQLTEACKNDSFTAVLLDAPLLFEAGLESRCDMVVLLVADMEVRIKRVCSRDNMTADEVRNRIKQQMSDEEKIKKSHIIVENSGTLDMLTEKLEKVYISVMQES